MERSSTGSRGLMSAKMGTWLLMITVAILFGSISLGYITNGHSPRNFSIPWTFYLNTLILIVSSVMLHIGWINRNEKGRGGMLRPAVLLGILFLVSQSFAWYQLYSGGTDWASSGQKVSYLYVLTFLHAIHLVGGILFLAYVWARFDRNGQKYLDSAIFFWHFLGILWIYLLCVLLINA